MSTTLTTTKKALVTFMAVAVLVTGLPAAAQAQVSGGAYRHEVRCNSYSGAGALDTNFLPGAKPGALMAASVLRWDPANPAAGWQLHDAVADVSGFQAFKYTYFNGSTWEAVPGYGDPMWQSYRVFSMMLGVRKANTMQAVSGFTLPRGSYYALRVWIKNPGSGWSEWTSSLVHTGATVGTVGSADGTYCYIG